MLHFVTGNANKLREISEALAAIRPDFTLASITLDLPELQGTMREISIAKAEAARRDPSARYPLIIEDTSLVFSALKQRRGDGLPGPYIKWFLENLDNAAIAAMLDSYADRSAQFHCCIAYLANAEAEPVLLQGTTSGHIVAPTFAGGFGWDNIFVPDGAACTYAEMDLATKRTLSARTQALKMLVVHLEE